jgi:hypothetical protein
MKIVVQGQFSPKMPVAVDRKDFLYRYPRIIIATATGLVAQAMNARIRILP